MDTNFWGVVDVTKRALGVFCGGEKGAKGKGEAVASMGGWTGFPGGSFYHAQQVSPSGAGPRPWPMSCLGPGMSNCCIVETGGVNKTNYATTSLRHIAPSPPGPTPPTWAYPTNALLTYMLNEQARGAWSEAARHGRRHGMIMLDIENIKKDLEELKRIGTGVGQSEQLKSIDFLKGLRSFTVLTLLLEITSS
ncbi:hypothetical protein PG988_003883 [Apiospora saccharicola]